MRVGSRFLAGFRLASLFFAVLLLALPAAARAQDGPAAVVFTDPPADTTSSTSETFVFAADGAASFECALDAAAFAPCSSPWPVEGLPQGSRTFTVRALDAGGTLVAEGAVTWVVDLDKPEATILTGPSGSTPTGPAQVTFESLDADVVGFECRIDAEGFAPCESPLDVEVEPGPHVLEVRAVDAAGNEGDPASLAWTGIEPDTTAPVIAFKASPAKLTKSGTAAFVVSVEAGAELTCRLAGPGRDDPPAPCDAEEEFDGLGTGDYTFEVQAEDAAGNTGTASHSWRVDQDAPAVVFTSAPPEVSTDASVELAFAGSEDGVALSCSLDGAPFTACASPVTVSSAVLGPRFLEVRATDAAGNTGAAARADWTASFAAAFDWAPSAALAGEPVTFTARAKGAVTGLAWDLDDDGQFDDGTGPTAQRTFAEAGSYRVRLQVAHPSGTTKETSADVAVGRTPLTTVPPVTSGQAERRPPVAAFSVVPQAPVAGQDVALTSTSSDPDGTIAESAWDLDGDGEFDDASGPSAARAFPEGAHIVGLRVVDADGLAATSFATVVVAAAPGPPAPPAPPAVVPAPAPKKLALLTPFPTVRIAGTAVGRRIQLRIFAVKAPRNTTVDVRCRGRGCPFKLDRHRVKGKARTVRIRRLERRTLRAGIVVEVRVHAPGRVGKYTRLQMRSGAAPKRTDACVSGTRMLKTACPA